MRYLLLFVLFLSACEVKVSTGADKTETPARNTSKIRNGIDVATTGDVKVEQAFLTYADNGSFVSDSNVSTINRPVKLNLVVSGWKGKDGKVSIDAAQKMTTSEGGVVLDEKDMFGAANPVSEKDAGYLSFQCVITRLDKLFDYFLVDVSARNKDADQQIKASFKMHVE